MKLRTIAVLGVTWGVAVVGSAAVTWGVIDVAGRQVLDDSSVPTVTANNAANNAGTNVRHDAAKAPGGSRRHRHPTSSSASPTRPAPSTRGTAKPGPAGPTRPPAPSSSPHTPAGSGGPRPGHVTQEPAHPSTGGSATAPPTPLPAPVTWTGAAGTLTVSCQEGRVRLQGATPADGYRVEVEQEDDAVEVQFKRENPEDEVHVRATCVNGRPRFDVEDDRPTDRPTDRPSDEPSGRPRPGPGTD